MRRSSKSCIQNKVCFTTFYGGCLLNLDIDDHTGSVCGGMTDCTTTQQHCVELICFPVTQRGGWGGGGGVTSIVTFKWIVFKRSSNSKLKIKNQTAWLNFALSLTGVRKVKGRLWLTCWAFLLSVVALRRFSAPSLIFSSLRISLRILSRCSSRSCWTLESEKSEFWSRPSCSRTDSPSGSL